MSPDKSFVFDKKPVEAIVCSLRKFHNHDEYIYAHKREKKPTDVITRCRECRIWLVVRFEFSPSSMYTGDESWHMISRVATEKDVEEYTRLGKVRDI